MFRENIKLRAEKRKLSKATDICRFYSRLQSAYADMLQNDDNITEIRCNYLLDGFDLGRYTTDFVCKTTSGEYLVRECIDRRLLTKPMTIKLLDASREYWYKKGIHNWGIVTNKVGNDDCK